MLWQILALFLAFVSRCAHHVGEWAVRSPSFSVRLSFFVVFRGVAAVLRAAACSPVAVVRGLAVLAALTTRSLCRLTVIAAWYLLWVPLCLLGAILWRLLVLGLRYVALALLGLGLAHVLWLALHGLPVSVIVLGALNLTLPRVNACPFQ